ncbi:EpsG family protein [Sunxiuqinia sp. sy24]|uniref:EpsG family protein n=1 Tax=Sunxiuqinia sp. sy24 TaxID=3461495 RepID=UPI0040462236
MTLAFSYLVYTTLLFSVLFFTYFAKKKHRLSSHDELFADNINLNFSHFIAIIFIAFIVGYRYEVGTDWYSYKLYFENGIFKEGKIEFGYRIINQIIYNLNGKYTLVFFIVSFISWYFIFKGFPNKLLPLGLYFLFCDEWFFFSTNGVRQFAAFGFFFYAIQFLPQRKFKKFLFWIFIAGLFHRSAWLLSLICIIPWSKLYHRNTWMIVYIFSFLFSQNATLLKIIPLTFSTLGQFIPFLNVYLLYFESVFYNAENISILNFGIVFRALVAIYILYYSKIIIDKYPNTKPYYVIFFLGTILTNVFIGIPILSRFIIYLTFFRPFLLALSVYVILHEKKHKFAVIASYAIILTFFILFLYIISISPYNFTFLNDH